MARYIDADEFLKRETRRCGSIPIIGTCTTDNESLAYRLATAPTADVAEVRHGKWTIKSQTIQMVDDVDEELYVECPFCERTFYVPYEFEDEKILEYARKNYPYCHCGARMDGDEE